MLKRQTFASLASIPLTTTDTAFLYGAIDEDIYIELPDYFDDSAERVCKLRKALLRLQCLRQRRNSISYIHGQLNHHRSRQYQDYGIETSSQ